MTYPSLPALVLLLLLLTGSAAVPAREESRTWTDTKGRKLDGTLIDKTATHAEIMRKDNSKRVQLKLADLSPADREYVAAAEVLPDPVMSAKTINVESNEAGTKHDARRIAVTLGKVRGRSYSLEVIWLGPKGNTVGIYKTASKDITEDGVLHFDVTYKGTINGVGPDYKGYVVGLLEDGEFGERWIAKAASQKPFERFLEEEAGD